MRNKTTLYSVSKALGILNSRKNTAKQSFNTSGVLVTAIPLVLAIAILIAS